MSYEVLESEEIYRGSIITLRRDQVRYPSGYEGTREVVSHPGACAVIGFTADGKIPLVKQYRHATGEAIWELPAGLLHPGEDPLECAIRELKEEVGGVSARYRSLGWFYTTAGFSSEKLYLFMAEAVELGVAEPEDGEEFENLLVTLEEALAKVEKGEIVDSKTIIGLLHAWRLKSQGQLEL